MKSTLVVAKYKEETNWITECKVDEVVIIDKENDLPNIGRESHSFLYYICLNYYNLSDITIFTQGNPFDHCKDFINKVNNIKYGNGYTPLSDKQLLRRSIDMTFYTVSDSIYNIQKTFGLEVKDITFPYGAIMAVDKENILKRPLSDYLKYLTLVSSSDKHTHEMEYLWRQVLE